jgi:hypothetical protein
MRKLGTFIARGSGDRAAATVSTATRKSRRTLFGTKIEQLFAEYRVNLGQILRPAGGSDPTTADGGRALARRADTK